LKISPLDFNLFIVWVQVKHFIWDYAAPGAHFQTVLPSLPPAPAQDTECLQPKVLVGSENRQWINAFAVWTFQPETSVCLSTLLDQIKGEGQATAIGLRKSDANVTVVALMRKRDKTTLPADRFLFNGVAAETFVPIYGRDLKAAAKITLNLFAEFHKFFETGTADFVVTPVENWSASMLLHVQRNLSLAQLEEQINDARIVYSSKEKENLANEYQSALVKAAAYCISAKKQQMADELDEQASLEQCRKNHAYVFEGSRAVLPNDCFQNIQNLYGTRVDEYTLKPIKITWMQYMSNPEYFEHHPAILLGGNGTSGFGKSALAIRSALNMGKAMAMERGLPASDGRCITRNSIEACRSLHDLRWPLVIDEFSPTDRSQAKHWSLDIAKVIGNMAMASDIAANYKNVDIPPHTPRIFTANAKSLDEWMGDKFEDCLPILRRFFVFILDPNPLMQNRMVIEDKLKEHLATIRKGNDRDSAITTDRMLSLWEGYKQPGSADDAAPAVVVANSQVPSVEAAPVAVVVDSQVPSVEAAPAVVVDPQAPSVEAALAVVVDSSVPSVEGLTSGSSSPLFACELDATAVDEITKLIVQAFAERSRARVVKPLGPPTTEEQAVFDDSLRGIYFHTEESDYVNTFTGCKVTAVGSAATSGNVAPGFLVLSRRGPGEDEGLWVLDLALFRESHS